MLPTREEKNDGIILFVPKLLYLSHTCSISKTKYNIEARTRVVDERVVHFPHGSPANSTPPQKGNKYFSFKLSSRNSNNRREIQRAALSGRKEIAKKNSSVPAAEFDGDGHLATYIFVPLLD
jgi:argonaute-like protein implicated in RNA metabolism and viral defense